ncbi:MAG: hypothetical protein J3Q66DRAFT_42595 [Benniella sp.]|nr:MAG: hypothetical protein J3Q66DRAFT_42595 [Benniella sp.]
MDPHMDIDVDKEKDLKSTGSRQPDIHYQGPAHQQQQQHRAVHHHPSSSSSSHRIASPQSHLHPQGASHAVMPPQRQPYYAASSPDPPPASSAPGASSAPLYRRPSSPGPYGNPPPGAYASAPASSAHPAHYSSGQSYARHSEYAKDDYRYSQQDRRREYDEVPHDYQPMTRDMYRSSSPTRHHHTVRDPMAVSSARRPPTALSAGTGPAGGYPAHPAGPSPHAPIYEDIHDRDRRPAHPYTGNSGRYPGRSPSPGPYGSPPHVYRQYYEHQRPPLHHPQQQQQAPPPQQQQQQQQRSYRQEYYISDGEGEGYHYHQQHPSRAPPYRPWPPGNHEASNRDYPPSTHQPPYYSSTSRQPMPSDRYETQGSVPPPRAASPYQQYSSRQSGHPGHSSAGPWPPTRSPEMAARPGPNYRRRSASVDETIERDKRKRDNVPGVLRLAQSPQRDIVAIPLVVIRMIQRLTIQGYHTTSPLTFLQGLHRLLASDQKENPAYQLRSF